MRNQNVTDRAVSLEHKRLIRLFFGSHGCWAQVLRRNFSVMLGDLSRNIKTAVAAVANPCT